MEKLKLTLQINTEKTALSSRCRLHKTELLVKGTRSYLGVDLFLTKLAEGILPHLDALRGGSYSSDECFIVLTRDGEHTFFFKLGSQCPTEAGLSPLDIVFFKYVGTQQSKRRNDRRFVAYLSAHSVIDAMLTVAKDRSLQEEFLKLYLLSNSDQVNFPLLNEQQLGIVMLEDQNVLVQGVAGSGKTNICIDKIIYAACREYAGRVLYTTFSRGLLLDIQSKINLFRDNLQAFSEAYAAGNVIFADEHKQRAVENKLGVWFSVTDESKIPDKIRKIITFLETKVDYFLIEDLYQKLYGESVRAADENYFVREYLGSIKNYQLAGKLERIKNVSYEVIYKEIYGMIFGCYDTANPRPMLTLAEYTAARVDSFTKTECEIIHSIAQDYDKHLTSLGLMDNNKLSRKLLQKSAFTEKYSLAVVDEVQDFTQLNLCLMKEYARKLFCVGDVLQMINPSYFSFSYLKRLMYDADVTTVAELKHNYRNSKRIEQLIEALGELNVKQFGTHSFVLKGQSVESTAPTATVYVRDEKFIEEVARQNPENVTVIVNGAKRKEELRAKLKNIEVLTISEIKGLERTAVILLDVLSDNYDKWQALSRRLINRKTADENSVYRYYFNLLYVGVSRAKQYLYVAERKEVALFNDFFRNGFEQLKTPAAVAKLAQAVGKLEVDEDELLERIQQFINLEQYDNATFTANKLGDGLEQERQKNRIEIFEKYVSYGKYREAGIRFWEKGLTEDARRQFGISGDKTLCELMDACTAGDSGRLGTDIVDYYPEMHGNDAAQSLILQVLREDLAALTDSQSTLHKKTELKLKGQA